MSALVEDSSLLRLVSGAATVFTIGLFSSGILTCRKIHITKSVGVVPHLPFVAAAVNCSMWMTYGFIKPDSTVALVNFVGLCLQMTYIFIYHTYTDNKYSIRRDFLLALAVVSTVILYYTKFVSDQTSRTTQLGVACNIGSILFFASPLSTMAEVIQSKSTDSMSFPLSVMSVLTTASWVLYGLLVSDFFIQFPNGIGLLLSLIQLTLFAVYHKKKKLISMEAPITL